MASYRGDPRWLRARFDSQCPGCDATIRKGAQIWYYPPKRYHRGGMALCEPCGAPMSREFYALAADEELYQQGKGV